MPRYVVRVYYDGRAFYGFQPQKDRRTAGGEIISALIRSNLVNDPLTANFQAASRTDRGVSAISQTVAFSTDKTFTTRRLNAFLPRDCMAWGWAEVKPGFNPRKEADERVYVYIHPYEKEDLRLMREASVLLFEKRNFGKLEINQHGNHVFFKFSSKSYARGMVRKVVSLLLKIGRGEIKPDPAKHAIRLLQGLSLGIPLAPAENLLLLDVKYGFNFHVDDSARKELLNRLQGDICEAEVKKLCVEKLAGEISSTSM